MAITKQARPVSKYEKETRMGNLLIELVSDVNKVNCRADLVERASLSFSIINEFAIETGLKTRLRFVLDDPDSAIIRSSENKQGKINWRAWYVSIVEFGMGRLFEEIGSGMAKPLNKKTHFKVLHDEVLFGYVFSIRLDNNTMPRFVDGKWTRESGHRMNISKAESDAETEWTVYRMGNHNEGIRKVNVDHRQMLLSSLHRGLNTLLKIQEMGS